MQYSCTLSLFRYHLCDSDVLENSRTHLSLGDEQFRALRVSGLYQGFGLLSISLATFSSSNLESSKFIWRLKAFSCETIIALSED
jgi:hypothetical protein